MCCKMKLDQALKLYIGLYCLCFMFSWFVSIPMIIHVSRDGECLLFVSPYITYGPAAGNQNSHNSMATNIIIRNTLCLWQQLVISNSYYRLLDIRLGLHCSCGSGYDLFCTSCHAIKLIEEILTSTRTAQLQRLSFSTNPSFLAYGKYILLYQCLYIATTYNIVEEKTAFGYIKKCYQIFEDDVISAYLKKDMTSFAYLRSTQIQMFIAV